MYHQCIAYYVILYILYHIMSGIIIMIMFYNTQRRYFKLNYENVNLFN